VAKKVRVLQLCAVDFTVRQFIAPLCLALEEEGYDVRAACTRGPHWGELDAMGVRMVEMPIARSANPLKALASVWKLRGWLRRERIEVLHVHTPVAAMVGRLAGWLAGVPVIFYTAHGFYFHDRMPRGKRWIHVALERFFGLFHRELLCVSEEDSRDAVALGIGRAGHTHFVSNGVSPSRFDPQAMAPARLQIRGEFSIPTGAQVVTIMGRMVREKGYGEFFAAARGLAQRFPAVHFLVIGDTVVSEHDDAKAEIVRAASVPELNDRVHFTGLRRDIPELLAATDVFVLPSHREGMPVSILEAMMMSLPVVATRIRGCREEVVDGETGFLVRAGNAEELEGAIAHLLAHPERARTMGEAGRERALDLFEEGRVMENQLAIYRRVLSEVKLS
jgi:glycosyltransferase involved in cell wall biosynthesis